MDIVRSAILKPVTVTVGVILVVMFGLIGFGAIPIQLTPNVDRPEITVTTSWDGRSPQEIVDEIVKDQEEQLKNVENLDKMTSLSRDGSATITLEFTLGADITRSLQEVSDALRQVPDYPDDVEEPVIKAASGESENAIAWIIIDLDPDTAANHPDFDVSELYFALDKEVKPFLERIKGVAEVNIYGGRDREMQVLVDLQRLAQYGLNHLELLDALASENRNVSAGTIAEGKRDYRVRVLGQYEREEDILNTIIDYRDNGPVYVRDVADVQLDYEKSRSFVRSLGHPAIAMNVIRQTGANVMDVMGDLKQRLEDVRADILPTLHPTAGPDLRLRQAYDETIYITSAIDLVLQNLWVGGALAAIVLLLFLRSFVATGVIALAIPIAVVGTFLVLLALGRSLNVISLAGLAFAVGMVVDNAIVVLENIFRHRQMGKTALRAAYDGGKEVWGAILASTLTTIAVFIPVLTVQEEAGQLFRDISLAIVSAVSLSLIVSITVIPAASSRWFADREHAARSAIGKLFAGLFGVAPLMSKLTEAVATTLHWLMTGWRGLSLRPAIIVLLTAASLAGAWALKPPLDYLPAGNRNLVFGFLLVPPGYAIDKMERIAQRMEDTVGPYVVLDQDDIDDVPTLPHITRPPTIGPDGTPTPVPPFDPVGVDNFFIAGFDGAMIAGATSVEPEVVLPVGQLLTNAMGEQPDSFGGARQTSLFGRGIGSGGGVDIEISGPDIERVNALAGWLFGQLGMAEEYGFGRVRPDPANFSVRQPETQVALSTLGTELGLRTAAIGTAVRGLFDGAYAGEFTTEGDAIDIRLLPKGGRLQHLQQMADIPVATPRGPVVPLDSLVEFREILAPQQVKRIEELPSVTVAVTPPEGVPLEQVEADLLNNYIARARDMGMIDRSMRVRLEGTAAQLDKTRKALIGAPALEPPRGAALAGIIATGAFWAVAVGIAAFAVAKSIAKKKLTFFYGALGIAAVASIVWGTASLFLWAPELMTARAVWAAIVTYLLMCALFESFVYPFVIMFSVPLALVGGFLGLSVVHAVTDANPVIATQNLDVLTMLGFVILVGVVVNNAILIVHQSLNLMRGEADLDDHTTGQHDRLTPMRAIAEATRTRVRPIFMSTMTSIGGMLPLVLFPGAGSELYRGLGSVVVGGLLVSTVFTLILVPLLLSITVQMGEGVAALRGIPAERLRARRDVILGQLRPAALSVNAPEHATPPHTNGDATRQRPAATPQPALAHD